MNAFEWVSKRLTLSCVCVFDGPVTDGYGAFVRVVLFVFKKAFDLIEHGILVRKLSTYDIHDAVISWITSFLSLCKQRVKLGRDCLSEWAGVPAGVPQDTKLG